MIEKLTMPKLGWTMTKGKVIKWLKDEGNGIKKREPILKIETDKVTLDVESPIDGYLRKILVKEKITVPVGKVLALLSDSLTEELPEEIEEEVEEVEGVEEKSRADAGIIPEKSPIATKKREGRIFASPRARKLAREEDIEIANVRGTGPNGRIIERDVQNYIEYQLSNKTQMGLPVIRTIPMEGIRKTIAERMTLSKRTAPSVTITMETDTSNLQMFRKMLIAQENIKISFTDIIVKIVAECLRKHPIVNSTIEGSVIKIIKDINVGVAVATDRGLIVPVIKHADELSIPEISLKSREKVNKTRNGNINLNDVTGGTFTVSNLGMFDVEIFTPIINPPEAAILGIGKIIDKPISRDKKVVIRPMMQLSLTHDHRSIDGDMAAKFLGDVKQLLENPMQLIKKKELEISEKIPEITDADADVIVIGSGPGGHAAAIRAKQLGKSVIIIEKDKLGGICVNRGCIPTKLFFKEAELIDLIDKSEEREFGVQVENYNLDFKRLIDRKNEITGFLSESIGRTLAGMEIEIIKGKASFIDKNTIKVLENDSNTRTLKASAIIIATGMRISKKKYPGIKKSEVLNTDELLDLRELPSSITIIGCNYIALEFASILNKMGSRVSIITEDSRILINEDKEIIQMLEQALDMENIEIYSSIDLNTIRVTKKDNGKKLLSFIMGGETNKIESDMILDTMERESTIEDLNIDKLGIDSENGIIKTNQKMRTNILGIYAIGDITGNYNYSHVATQEGIVAAQDIAEFKEGKEVNYNAIPRSFFTFPEVAFAGLSEEDARAKHKNIMIIRYPIAYNSMARIVEAPEGLIKIIGDKSRGNIIGVGIIGKNATELIAEFSTLIDTKLSINKISSMIHSHPTFSESIKESLWEFFINK
ncbi:MAG: dihydrolipoyl dehydrogenase [Candidatus Lokiarchaeota archaeon]|nr:dihydrolipoyl dehydrogenase [Candidatus Lokiarchaeota archaeon]